MDSLLSIISMDTIPNEAMFEGSTLNQSFWECGISLFDKNILRIFKNPETKC
ncbi:hypothetical protein RO3G_06659 [Rhizopus delemar RA 99-880]|uniref:Uncharacterized protein n=1 Tax=Rhizopus delemar (strain RA 99-880 / ATCC MYA-4621 / FGSC 9543 / NRRL 43880) TaxID=246409 RepID=I1C0H4_RHIO9|nr:hypothetical protein RO3G_06659 [Rhizopus delemar RA 99-880]|eukprot:EIE81954.1 hypothetical protein RO3G_06659 [Rhizopus delemar RA 99-880]